MEASPWSCCDSRNSNSCCDSRELSNNPITAGFVTSKNCGVGILFSINVEGALVVAALVPGSPAEASNLIKAGDVLHKVEDEEVCCKNPQDVHKLVMGAEGTSVRMSFKMEGSEGLVHVTLKRRQVGDTQRRAVVAQVAELQKPRSGILRPLIDVNYARPITAPRKRS